MIRAVFFDVGNTLLFPYPSVAEVCREVYSAAGYVHEVDDIERHMGLVDEYYEAAYREDDTFWTDEERTAELWVGMYSLLGRTLGMQEDAEELAGRIYDEFGDPARWMAYADVVPAFARLKERGLTLGVISNWDRRLECILEGLGLGEMLDTIVSSAVVGLHKPDPRIFEHACERVGVSAAESVHVGDHHYADVMGAQAAGLHPVLIDRHGTSGPGCALETLDALEDRLDWLM